ncbi:MAG: hypothetical protein GXP26_17685 [Planctomycetes bacterium]|nr:hypothetical protein [Planctomycetota bacterium]
MQNPLILAVSYTIVATLLCFTASTEATAKEPDAEPLAQSRTLQQAHSHNDYEHNRPLLDALEHRFCSVEADIWLIDDSSLLVGHDMWRLRQQRTLAALYLEPLLQRCRENQGWVYEPGQSIILLIDLKSSGEKTYPVLAAELRKYRALFVPQRVPTSTAEATSDPSAKQPKTQPAVIAILSGNRPVELVTADKDRLCGIDGRLGDLPSSALPELVPLVSDTFKKHFCWRGEGPISEAERIKLRKFVSEVHDEGRRLRFWATPDSPAVWSELRAAGVDLIGTDDLPRLAQFLTASPPASTAPTAE